MTTQLKSASLCRMSDFAEYCSPLSSKKTKNKIAALKGNMANSHTIFLAAKFNPLATRKFY